MGQRRGRPSRSDYIRLVASLVRCDMWELNDCETFANYPGVRTLVSRHQRACLPMGVALKLLIDRAVTDVIETLSLGPVGRSARVATFLQLWYNEGQTVVAVAKVLDLHRTHVVASVQRPALELVATRFLELAEQIDPLPQQTTNSGELRAITRTKSA